MDPDHTTALLPKNSSQPPANPPDHGTPRPLLSRTATGFLFMFLSAVAQAMLISFMHVSEKRYGFPGSAVLMVRAPVSTAMSLFVLVSTGDIRTLARIPRRQVMLLVLRGAFGGILAYCKAASLQYIKAGPMITIFSVTTILTSAGAALLFGEPFTLVHVALLIANFAGVALVALPGGGGGAGETERETVLGVTYAVGTAVAAAVVVLVIKPATAVPAVASTMAFGLGCFVVGLATSRPGDFAHVLSNSRGAAWALASALGGFGTQTFLAVGVKRAPAGPCVVIRTFGVPLVFLFGYYVMGETIGLVNLAGVVLVVVSVILTGLLTQRLEEREARETAAFYSER